MATTHIRGNLGEDFACCALERDGYHILERNWRYSHSEIDIIAARGDIIAFIEVKTRTADAKTTPVGAVGKAQRRRIALAAVEYLRARGIYNTGAVQPRFDVFEVVTAEANSPEVTRWEHLTGAFDTGDLDVFI